MYGNIPVGKGDDDGSIFGSFLKQSKLSAGSRSISWEEIRDILEKYKVRAKISLKIDLRAHQASEVHSILKQGAYRTTYAPFRISLSS
jgi:hypothetical protein